MLYFKFFLTEAVSDESKLTHLEHAEDHVINAGEKGFAHAYHNLHDVHDMLKGKHTPTTVTTKYDGSPSVVWGHHPESGKFFVGTKSVFNKEPKINHTPEDIEKNHGHAPGLVSKLKLALKHLPKITPKGKIFQGDLMHSGVQSKSNPQGDVENKNGKYHFKPNTITYSTKHDSEEGQKILHSKIGVVPHTEYKGKQLTSMKAHYNADVSKLKTHDDVHVISPHNEFKKDVYSKDSQQKFEHHIGQAVKAFNDSHKDFYKAISSHTEHLKTYINHTVKTDSAPTVKGYQEHLTSKFTKEADKLKTEKGKVGKMTALAKHVNYVEQNNQHFKDTLAMHHHLAAAKNVLVHAMSTSNKFEHHIGGIKTKPEGFVAVRNNRPTKLVDRKDFSRANFLSKEK